MARITEEIPVGLVVPADAVIGHLQLLAVGHVQAGGVAHVAQHPPHHGVRAVRQPCVLAHAERGLHALPAGQRINRGALHVWHRHGAQLSNLLGAEHVVVANHQWVEAVLLQLERRQQPIGVPSTCIATAQPTLLGGRGADLAATHLLVVGELLGELWAYRKPKLVA